MTIILYLLLFHFFSNPVARFSRDNKLPLLGKALPCQQTRMHRSSPPLPGMIPVEADLDHPSVDNIRIEDNNDRCVAVWWAIT